MIKQSDFDFGALHGCGNPNGTGAATEIQEADPRILRVLGCNIGQKMLHHHLAIKTGNEYSMPHFQPESIERSPANDMLNRFSRLATSQEEIISLQLIRGEWLIHAEIELFTATLEDKLEEQFGMTVR
jgi:hypothetical protein